MVERRGDVLAVLGGGSMGSAIAAGAATTGAVRMTTRSAARAAEAPAGVETRSLEAEPGANRWATEGAAVVVVAVKPAGVLALLEELAPVLPSGAAVVSVAAGVSIERMAAVLGPGAAVLRAMPNTPAAVGRGVTGLSPGAAVTSAQLAAATAVFEAVGTVLVLPEERIDALSAISGSGPAYVFYAVEQLRGAARRLGFDEAEAALLVDGTAAGALALLADTGLAPAELRRRVTSPSGTTERAVAVFEQHDLAAVLDEAFAAAIARARELATG